MNKNLSDQLEINTYESHDLTICDFLGNFQAPILRSFVRYFYSGDNHTKHLIINASQISGERLTTNDIFIIISQFKNHASKRKRGKTAFVVNSSLDRMLAIVSMNIAENENYPIELSMFTSNRDALKWMNVDLDLDEIEAIEENERV